MTWHMVPKAVSCRRNIGKDADGNPWGSWSLWLGRKDTTVDHRVSPPSTGYFYVLYNFSTLIRFDYSFLYDSETCQIGFSSILRF